MRPKHGSRRFVEDEYYSNVAVGYRKTHDDRIEKHPDARVQNAIKLVFDKFLELGSARQLLLWMREHQLELPANRNHHGGEVLWNAPSLRLFRKSRLRRTE